MPQDRLGQGPVHRVNNRMGKATTVKARALRRAIGRVRRTATGAP